MASVNLFRRPFDNPISMIFSQVIKELSVSQRPYAEDETNLMEIGTKINCSPIFPPLNIAIERILWIVRLSNEGNLINLPTSAFIP